MNIYDKDHEAAVKELLADYQKEYSKELKKYNNAVAKHDAWEQKKTEAIKQWEADAKQESEAFAEQRKANIEKDYKKRKESIQRSMKEAVEEKQKAEEHLAELGFFAFGDKKATKDTIKTLVAKLQDLEKEQTTCSETYEEALRNLEKEKQTKNRQLAKTAEKKFKTEFPEPIAPEKPKPMPKVERVDPDDLLGVQYKVEEALKKGKRTLTSLLQQFPDFLNEREWFEATRPLLREKVIEREEDGGTSFVYHLGVGSVFHPKNTDYMLAEEMKRRLIFGN